MKKTALLLIFCMAVTGLTACYDIREISYTVAAIALGIDKGENMKYRVSFHIEKSGNNEEDEESEKSSEAESDLIIIEAPTVSSAYERVNDLTSVDVSIDNLKMVILSEDICKEGIYDIISELMCDMNLKNNAYVVSSRGDAKDIMDKINPEEEEYLSIFYQRILFNRYKSETKYFLIEEIYFDMLENPGKDIVLPLANQRGDEADGEEKNTENSLNLGYVPKQEKHEIEFSGGTAFKDGVFIGYLTENDMTAAALLDGTLKTRKVSVEYPENSGKYAVIELKQHKKPHYVTEINDGRIDESVTLKLIVTYQFIDESVSYDEFNPKFSKYLKSEINKMCEAYIKKSIYGYETDILSLGKRLRSSFLLNRDFENFNYKEKMKSGAYSVSTKLDMKSGGRFVFR